MKIVSMIRLAVLFVLFVFSPVRGCHTDAECADEEACFVDATGGECGDLSVMCDLPQYHNCGTNETCAIRHHEVVCLPKHPVCQTNDHCEDYEACFPDDGGICGDLTINCVNPGYSCSANETCTIRNHQVLCLPTEPGCKRHRDCPSNMTCVSPGRCEDPCMFAVCEHNSRCKTTEHIFSCECLPGYHRAEPDNPTSPCKQCLSHSECEKHLMCVSGKCQEPCTLYAMCGENTKCQVRNHRMLCECVSGTVRINLADVTSACEVPECVGSSDCGHNKYCRQHKCVRSPCPDVCGPNTRCEVSSDGEAICSCKSGFQGTPGDRNQGCQPRVPKKSEELGVDVRAYYGSQLGGIFPEYSFHLQTHGQDLEMTKLHCCTGRETPYSVTVKVTPVGATQADTVTVTSSGYHVWGTRDHVPMLTADNKPVVLARNTLYNIVISYDTHVYVFTLPQSFYQGRHFDLTFSQGNHWQHYWQEDYARRYGSPVYGIFYKTLTTT